jgi:diacylglycerol kinase (ATP)
MEVQKNRSITLRMRDGLAGLAEGWNRERAVRTHLMLAGAGLLVLILASVRLNWLLTYLVLGVLGLAAELMNGAIEATLDRLHPADDSDVGAAKDMSSAAALVIDAATVGVFVWALMS